MDKIMDINKLTELRLLKKEIKEFRQQSKSLENENRALEQIVAILKDPVVITIQNRKNTNDDDECVMILL